MIEKMVTIEVQVEAALLEEVKIVLKPYGITPEQAVVMFLKYCTEPATTEKAIVMLMEWKKDQDKIM